MWYNPATMSYETEKSVARMDCPREGLATPLMNPDLIRRGGQIGLAAATVRKPTVAVAVLCCFRQLRASSLYEEGSSPQ
jgi:hypothetical protein